MQIPHTPPESPEFKTIYRLAKARDEKSLTQLIDSGGVSKRTFRTPAMLLAKEGDREAVEFLINKFNASLQYATRGAAWGGHIEFVNDLIARGASLIDAVNGAARGRW